MKTANGLIYSGMLAIAAGIYAFDWRIGVIVAGVMVVIVGIAFAIGEKPSVS